jgi:hypothetical protein
MDLAARSRRPALVFTDVRFRGLLRAPAPMMQVNFDAQEIAAADGDTPATAGFRKKFNEFCDHVEAWGALRLNESSNPADSVWSRWRLHPRKIRICGDPNRASRALSAWCATPMA